MELKDLKNTWQKEKEELESRILLDERLIRDLAFDKSKGLFNKFVKTAIIGRNLALIYMTISFFVASTVYEDFRYFIPIIIGGLAMLFSFLQHLSIERPDFGKMSTIEFQKSVCKFRIHISKYAKYDALIVTLWLMTLLPTYLNYVLNLQLSFLQLFPILLIVAILIVVFSKDIYKKWDKELKENEEQLQKIIVFETL